MENDNQYTPSYGEHERIQKYIKENGEAIKNQISKEIDAVLMKYTKNGIWPSLCVNKEEQAKGNLSPWIIMLGIVGDEHVNYIRNAYFRSLLPEELKTKYDELAKDLTKEDFSAFTKIANMIIESKRTEIV